MQHRRSAFKSTKTRSAAPSASAAKLTRFSARRFGAASSRRRSKKRVKLPAYEYILNPSTPRTNFYNRCITIKNANSIAGSGSTYGFTSVFSLTGTLPDSSRTSLFANCNNGGTTGISELSALQGLFAAYKIDKVVLTFTQKFSEFTDAVEFPNMWIRYNYDPNRDVTSGGGVAQFDSSTDVKVHRFSNESQVFQYTVYPKVMTPSYAYTGITADGYAYGTVDKNPWIDLSTSGSGAGSAVPFWGVDCYFGNIPTNQQIQVDVELHCAFKWQH